MKGLKKAGGNWVDGDRFFDREVELEALSERVREGTHTLLTAQRRMGKTSLVRELLRRLADESSFETIFVDLEGAHDSADAVAEIAIQARSVRTVWSRIRSGFANFLKGVGDRVEALEVADVGHVYEQDLLSVGGQIDLEHYQPVAKVITAFDRPCIPADGVAIRAHTPGMHPNRALSGGRRNGLGARGTFTTDCYESRLRMILGSQSYKTALSLLTEAAVNDGLLKRESIEKYRTDTFFRSRGLGLNRRCPVHPGA